MSKLARSPFVDPSEHKDPELSAALTRGGVAPSPFTDEAPNLSVAAPSLKPSPFSEVTGGESEVVSVPEMHPDVREALVEAGATDEEIEKIHSGILAGVEHLAERLEHAIEHGVEAVKLELEALRDHLLGVPEDHEDGDEESQEDK